MAVDILKSGLERLPSDSRRGILASFVVTLFTSALLLFVVQPLFTKLALPRLGGSPAVWSVALVFFQTMLLLGYAYAHLLTRFFSPRIGVAIHVSVMIAGLTFLPITYPAGFEEAPQSGFSLWLLSLLFVGIGFPFFAVSANAPLLQHWFSRTGHVHSADPYFLYGASNVGSFAALFLYPFVLEPLIGLESQTVAWSWAYGLLVVSVFGCGVLMIKLAALAGTVIHPLHRADETGPSNVEIVRLGWTERLRWMALSMVPSGLLVSVTASITTDLVAAPLFWVMPLALFLLTFVITFQRLPLVGHNTILTVHSIVIAPAIILMFFGINHLSIVAVHLVVFFVSAMVCHGELVAHRPKVRYLTEFYLCMSFGGVLGGLFASLAAPQLFNQIYEYPILLVLVFFCRRDVINTVGRRDWNLFWPAGLLVLGIVGIGLFRSSGAVDLRFLAVVPLLIAALIALRRHPLAQVSIVCLGIVFGDAFVSRYHVLQRERSFFGVVSVSAHENDGRYHLLKHGTTLHGAEQRTDAAGEDLTGRPEPLTYYQMRGPLAVAVKQLRAATGSLGDVALVGVGTGAMACHREDDERWRFYEIDPLVMKFARDTRYFRYLSACGESAGVVIGDGRIGLTKEPDEKFDLIVLDAFSSDTVPAHLLTREALSIYFAKLKPNGAIVMHISNRYMDLMPIVSALADDQGAAAYFNTLKHESWSVDTRTFRNVAQVAVIGRDAKRLRHITNDKRWQRLEAEPNAWLWTDNFSNVLGAIYRKIASDN